MTVGAEQSCHSDAASEFSGGAETAVEDLHGRADDGADLFLYKRIMGAAKDDAGEILSR